MPVKRNADAVIISSFDISETERRTLEQLGMPVIGVNTIGLTEQRDMISIGVDEITAMRKPFISSQDWDIAISPLSASSKTVTDSYGKLTNV